MKIIKNKKSMEVSPLSMVIGAVLLGVVLLVVLYGVLPIFTGKEVPAANSYLEYSTQDCDEDGIVGLNDPCPCVAAIKSKQELENGKNCGTPDQKAAVSCPNYCKIKK